ncbi:MAG: PilT protein [Candidatus Woesebacteria bacterium GW2011_GWA1_39_21b]|uniref:PilT protein n=1 Tax=Candidatus Woesebacteria bacterium GW2011_GWA1_39_21b TaxID=1618551 RepID=A0A0G0NJZ5_9BACT|nr:MAG: PilT protein [Microgenomates group bacterium GW2011_GWC1_38_12]KKR13111.1 MAG: PilT protein [Candidatus Woesebacteria bacterium GW2011_GWA1_39_21b]KKS76714.1 MAG: PilT protein [Parcubacteria group bacterium GW2011_GWB1_42_9]
MILLDTHILIWWLNGSAKLSNKALREIKNSKKKEKIFVSSISIWEIAMLVKKKRLKLTLNVESWIREVERLTYVNFLPVDNNIAFESVYLPEFKHKDPADRIIVATARGLRAKLITSDIRILRYPHIQTIW